METTANTILDTASFEEKVTIVVARSNNKWRIAAWRVMVFDENLLDLWINGDN